MKKHLITIFAILLLANNVTYASGYLEQTEILEILKTLTDKPISTWIASGTIKGTHFEYSAPEGSIVELTEQVKYDGSKFFWEINISPDEISGDLPKDIAKDLRKNARRIFVWDGERYTMYFATTNNAMVTDGSGDIPVNVNGPLTAGLIPWGYGVYTYAELSTAALSAVEDYQGHIRLTVRKEDKPEMVFLLDPSQNYAVLTYWLNNSDGDTIIKKDYSDFELAGDILIPTSIIIERYDSGNSSDNLLSRDQWEITHINMNAPKSKEFVVPYKDNAYVEFRTSLTDTPLSYNFSNTIDTEQLLQDRLEIASTVDFTAQNCATIAVRYVLSQFGKETSRQQLEQIVGPQNDTNLYDMRQFVRDAGLYSSAITTDLKMLSKLNSAQIILYLSGTKHYVVLEHIDSKYVWLIDLDSNKFYHRISLADFNSLWGQRIALIISEKTSDSENLTELDDYDLRSITGSAGGGIPNYSCDDLIQKAHHDKCPPSIGGLCGGRYWVWRNKYGCIEDESGGSCTGTEMLGKLFWSCKESLSVPGECKPSGDSYSRYIRACK